MGAVGTCERSHWGHETCEGCANTGAAGECTRSHCGLRWGSKWATKRARGVPTWVPWAHASAAIGALVGFRMGPRSV
eukprot:682610-Pyramimonas_sp.AAC.1